MKKIILTDIDGVMLDWVSEFDHFIKETQGWNLPEGGHETYDLSIAYDVPRKDIQKLIREYNNSHFMSSLSPLRDAVDGVDNLRSRGYEFHAITSFNSNEQAIAWRNENIESVFGKGAITDMVCLRMGSGKRNALLAAASKLGTGLYWLEDHPGNAETGLEIGFRSILFSHPYNTDYAGEIPFVDTWAELQDIIE